MGGGGRTKIIIFDGLGGGGQKNNSAKTDWVDLDPKMFFPVADFFRQGGLFNSGAVVGV